MERALRLSARLSVTRATLSRLSVNSISYGIGSSSLRARSLRGLELQVLLRQFLQHLLCLLHHLSHHVAGRLHLLDGAGDLAGGHEPQVRVAPADGGVHLCAIDHHLGGEGLDLPLPVLPLVQVAVLDDAAVLAGEAPGDLGALFGGLHDLALVVVVAVGLPGGHEASAHPDTAGAQREGGHEAPAVSDAAGSDDRDGRDRVHDLGHQGHGGDAAGVAAALGPLGDDDVGAALGDLTGVADGAYHGHDGHAVIMHLLRVWGGAAQPGGENGYLLIEHDLDHLLLAGPVLSQEEVDREWLIGQILDFAHLVAQGVRGHQGGADDAEAAGLGHGRHERGHRDTAHAGLDDRVLDAKLLGQLRLEHDTLLSPFELGFALLEEGSGRLLTVLAAHRGRLQEHGRVQGQVDVVAEELVYGELGPADGERRPAGQSAGYLHGPGQHLLLWHGVVHQADALRLLAVYPLAGEEV